MKASSILFHRPRMYGRSVIGLDAFEPGKLIPIHQHRKSSKTVVSLRGRLVGEYYSDAGELVDSVELAPCSPVVAVNIPIGQWHTVRALESGTVIMEVKDGSYEQIGEEDVMKND